MSSLKSGRPLEILLVEDNEGDALLAREGFCQVDLVVNLHHVTSGQKCLAFLRKEEGYRDRPTPDLILLDINMPGMSGHEVLAALVADPALAHLPVIVWTVSTRKADISRMYSLRCNAYIVKPLNFHDLLKSFQIIKDFWFKLAELPTPKIDTVPRVLSYTDPRPV